MMYKPIRTYGQNENLAQEIADLSEDLLLWQDKIEKTLLLLDHMYTFNEIVAGILAGKYHFYRFEKCCLIGELTSYAHCSVYHCFIACGDINDICKTHEFFENEAKNFGCKYLTLAGRPGWARHLKEHDWEHKLSLLYKEIS